MRQRTAFNVVMRGIDGRQVMKLKITEIDRDKTGEQVDFAVELQVDMGNDVLMVSQRMLPGFPLNALNSAALLKAVMSLFDENQLGMDDSYVDNIDRDEAAGAPALARGLDRPLPEIQAGPSQLRDNGPALRGGQQEQHGQNRGWQEERPEDCQ